jgi:hypothetical protein
MSWLKKLLGKKPDTPREDTALDTKESTGTIKDDDPRISEGHARLDAYWSVIGDCDLDLISYLVNPQFQGAPAWPNMRQAFRVVRTQTSLIIASDGLSDPFVGTSMDNSSGFGVEVYIEIVGAQGMEFDDIKGSAAFGLIESVARNVADIGGLGDRLARFGVLSMEVPASPGFDGPWTDSEGYTGILIGMPVTGREGRIQLPFGPVDLVPVTVITLSELQFLTSGGAEARRELAEQLSKAGSGHLTDFSRSAAVP